MLKPSLKNKKIIFLSILVVILIVVLSFIYLKPPPLSFLRKQESKNPKPVKPPKVKTYKQEVIMSISFDIGKTGQSVVIPKDPKKYGLIKEGYEMEEWGPTSITVDKQENVYVLDSVASRIKKYNKYGKFIKNIPSPYEWPNDLAVDNEGNLYILDEGEYSVLKINQDGKVLLKYPLSEELAPKGVSSLYSVDIVSNVLYGVQRFSKVDLPGLFEAHKGLRNDELASYKIGTTKKQFSSKQQVDSVQAGIPGEDGNFYDWYRRKDDRVVYFSPNNESIPKILFKDIDYELVFGSQETIIDRNGNVYGPYSMKNKESFDFLIQKYSKGHLVAEAILMYGSDYQWTKLVAVSDTGNIYYLYSDALSKDYKGGVRLIKCTLK